MKGGIRCAACQSTGMVIRVDVNRTTDTHLIGDAVCLDCGTECDYAEEVVEELSLGCVLIRGRPVAEGAGCPECKSMNVSYIGLGPPATDLPWVEFLCNACGHEARLEGRAAYVMLGFLATQPPPVDPKRN